MIDPNECLLVTFTKYTSDFGDPSSSLYPERNVNRRSNTALFCGNFRDLIISKLNNKMVDADKNIDEEEGSYPFEQLGIELEAAIVSSKMISPYDIQELKIDISEEEVFAGISQEDTGNLVKIDVSGPVHGRFIYEPSE